MYRKTGFALWALCTLTLASAQNPCGTQLPEHMKEWLRAHAGQYVAPSGTRTTYDLPIHIHLVGRDNGTGFQSLEVLWQNLCDLNDQFAETGFRFYLKNYPTYIFNSAYYEHDYDLGAEMMFAYNVPQCINVYVVGSAADNCGYYWGWPDAIAISKGCFNIGNTTFAHELGHYFSLPHPFDNINGILEYVDGSNCTVGGDLFCDTRADILNYRWDCPYTGGATDPKGMPYDPDSSLFMSYALDQCTYRFSPQQQNAMINYLNAKRSYLKNQPKPDMAPITGTVQLLHPVSGDTMVPNDFVEFRWSEVPGATFYHLQATRYSNFHVPDLLNVLVEGTSFTTWLKPGYTYSWRVKPLNKGYFCAPYSATGKFATVQGTGVGVASASLLQVFPTVVGQGQQVQVSGVSSHEPFWWQLLTIAGAVVASGQALPDARGMCLLALPDLPSGLYLLRAGDQGRTGHARIIVQ
ncbi:MAG: hypothetical protein NZL95_07895 [Chitinophagales bacterium]|nr:hypothetical protein [Chitinophagales bacterium]MDW8428459.1 hypothetical protein [Chitinophagales bacterium]